MSMNTMRKYFAEYINNECDGDVIDNLPLKVEEFVELLTRKQRKVQCAIFGGVKNMEDTLGEEREEGEDILVNYINCIVLNEEWIDKTHDKYVEKVGWEFIEKRRDEYMDSLFPKSG